mmetsp:Transcript_35195/g.113365  ORF Transcript_35195/g.113365 Transcript_35195/m.113365 type:complete len:330 (+) Transcript_35195:266-1255(+)
MDRDSGMPVGADGLTKPRGRLNRGKARTRSERGRCVRHGVLHVGDSGPMLLTRERGEGGRGSGVSAGVACHLPRGAHHLTGAAAYLLRYASCEVEEGADHSRLVVELARAAGEGIVQSVGFDRRGEWGRASASRRVKQIEHLMDLEPRIGPAHAHLLDLGALLGVGVAIPGRVGRVGLRGFQRGGADALGIQHEDVARGGLEAVQLSARVAQGLQPHIVREGLTRPGVVGQPERARAPVPHGLVQPLGLLALGERTFHKLQRLANHLRLGVELTQGEPRRRREDDGERRRCRRDDLHVLVRGRLHASLRFCQREVQRAAAAAGAAKECG